MRRFFFQTPGWSFDQGPIEALDLEAAKAEIRRRLGVRRLPQGTKVFDMADRPMARYRILPAMTEPSPMPLFA